MKRFAALLLIALPMVGGCGSSTYQPVRSPRIAMISGGYVKHGEKLTEVFGGALVEAVQGNPRAEAKARTARNLTVAGFVLAVVGITAEVSGVAVMTAGGAEHRAQDRANPDGPTPSNAAQAVGLGVAIGGVLVAITGVILLSNAPARSMDAINIYNDGVDAGAPARPGTLSGKGARALVAK